MQARYPHSFCYNKHIIVYPDIKGKKKREREKIGENFKMRPKIELRKILLCCLGESERDAVNRIAQKYSKSMRRSRG